jgi:two-component system sensor histidine kinase KdpD
MTDQRPDPDELLSRINEEQAKARRGKLKIFFGASAGVGKTYAMLSAGQQLRAQGIEVVIGIVETHGRVETEAMVAGLERLPLREIAYKDRVLREFDLDAALARKPTLMLVDELAHSNASGSRHPKRWQDVDELLSAGIDVYSTMNVQHLETLNDVVGGITGVRVWEMVPDKVFDAADEVVLVDLPPDELLQRLKEGKVYLAHQAERAIQNFFRKGNLIALRELALRRTADRVDSQMLEYRRDQSVAKVWQTQESMLACIGPDNDSEKIIRATARMAGRFDVHWHAIYVETPTLQRLPDKKRQTILKVLKTAQDMGAETAALAGSDAAASAVDYARSHNLSRLVMGHDGKRSWQPWRRRFSERVGRLSPDLDVIQVGREDGKENRAHTQNLVDDFRERMTTPWQSYVMSALVCAAMALVATPLRDVLDLANIVMLFLLGVVVVALRYGRGPAVLASIVSVAAFDFFFVPPRLSFAVSDVQYLLTFAVMLVVGLAIGQLTAGLRYQARVATQREGRVQALYEMARDLSGALMPEQIAEICDRFVEIGFGAKAAILLADEQDRLQILAPAKAAPAPDLGIAQWAFDHGEAAGQGTDTLPGSPILYLPLKAPMRQRGVLALELRRPQRLWIPEQQRLLDTFARLIAIALERVHYVDVAQSTTVQMESERLRNSILSTLSHDLRTPIAALVGLAESLALTPPALSDRQKEIAGSIREGALRMNALVNNLLDMARLQAREIKLKREWQPLEEVVGSALNASASLLGQHSVDVKLPADLPLLEFDAVLIERVLCNLIENATKYTPAGSRIVISATAKQEVAEISVADNGPGLPLGEEEAIFRKFTRGQKESAIPGVGLGLAICKAIVEAHHGKIWAEHRDGAGARFVFTLPLGNPPSIEGIDDMHATGVNTNA